MVALQSGDRTEIRKPDALRALTAARWYNKLKESSNEKFMELFADRHYFLVLMGGGGSGKSIFAGRKIIERCVHEPGHRFLVCRKTGKSLRHSCFDQLKRQATQWYPDETGRIPKGDSSEMVIRFKNGSEILFSGLDDVEKLKSIVGITSIWIEEASEIEEGDLNQLDIRLRDKSPYYKQIILSFNPISITHWLKGRFFDRDDKRARTVHSTYKDNRFLPEDERLKLESYREIDPYYYQVYCLGMWGVLSASIFNKDRIAEQLQRDRTPVRTGHFDYHYDGALITEIRFSDDKKQREITIWEEPVEGHPYVIGCDTAGEGSDWFVAQIIDNTTGKQVATYRIQTDEDLFAQNVYCLGMWYNKALVAIEANFSTHPIKELRRLGYPKQFLRKVEDSITKTVQEKLGVRTDALTRPIMLATLVEIVRDHVQLIMDETTLQEMLTFARNEKGRPEAIAGAHDDCVMAMAITYYARQQQRATIELPKAKKAKWRKDQWEDYHNARSEAERKTLLELWGNPF